MSDAQPFALLQRFGAGQLSGANRPIRLRLAHGRGVETDAQGLTQILKPAIQFGRFTIEAIND